jgi:hypothetical protein
MSKTPFKLPGERVKNLNAAADAWVEDGTRKPEAPRRGISVGKPARLTIDLPPELHARFKAACALQGSKMVAEVVRFIEGYTQKNT